MADEFAKGFAILMTAGLGWMTLAGWYRTPEFEGDQLIGHVELANPTVYDQIGIFLMDGLFWFAIIGALTFWVVLPMLSQARTAWAQRSE